MQAIGVENHSIYELNFDLQIKKSELMYNDKPHVIHVNSLQTMIT
jgi:hypothetical protein